MHAMLPQRTISSLADDGFAWRFRLGHCTTSTVQLSLCDKGFRCVHVLGDSLQMTGRFVRMYDLECVLLTFASDNESLS